MKIVVIYQPNSEHARKTEEYVDRLKSLEFGVDVELIDASTPDAINQIELYGITVYPAIMVLREDGSMQGCWQGDSFPLTDDIRARLT